MEGGRDEIYPVPGTGRTQGVRDRRPGVIRKRGGWSVRGRRGKSFVFQGGGAKKPRKISLGPVQKETPASLSGEGKVFPMTMRRRRLRDAEKSG